jgi:hypothetical protein
MREQSQQGVRGYLTGSGGSNNNIGLGAAGAEVGFNNFLVWANTSNRKSSLQTGKSVFSPAKIRLQAKPFSI